MSNKILVAYATGAGATEGVAEAIGKTLREGGANVDVKSIKTIDSISGYKAIVAGSGVRAGRVYGHMVKFLKKHEAALSQMPVAYFVVCLTMAEPTEKNREEVGEYLNAVQADIPNIKPVDRGLFAGALDLSKLNLPMRLIMKAMKAKEGDFRDWDAIHNWAEGLREKL